MKKSFLHILTGTLLLVFLLVSCTNAAGIDNYDDYFKKANQKVKTEKQQTPSDKKNTEDSPAPIQGTVQYASMNIGYVDIAALCIIHPVSDFYYAHEKSFVKPYEGSTLQEREREFKDRMIERTKSVAEATKKIESLRTEIRLEEKNRDMLRNKLDTKIKMTRSAMIEKLRKLPSKDRKAYRDKIEKQISGLENDIYEQYKKIDEKIAKLAENYKKYRAVANTSFYAESDQKEEIVGRIIEDIYTAVKEVAAAKKLDQVFNSSFFGMRLQNLHENQYELLFNEQYEYQMFKSVPSYALGIAGDKLEYYKSRLNSQATYIEPFWNSNFLRKSMILGGEDITIPVLKKIFNKYGKPESDIEAVITAYNESKNRF